ncbi:hypothetical protein GGR57DRAFT_447181 [Xylariaceae sp. FL1272]|nr:hypothetical protein GGR57DRAFT_447181 [Xylariaceae sp. FL1272]
MQLIKYSLLSLAAVPALATPMPMIELGLSAPETELLVQEGIKLAQTRDLDKRISADFSLERTWNNEVLFGGAWNDSQPDAAEDAKLSVTCLECYTRGTVTAKLTDHDIFKPALRLEFSDVEAYAFLGVEVNAAQTFSLTLFSSDSPIGIGISGLDVGVVFFVDLVFHLSEEIDLTAGFEVQVPNYSYLEADIFGGDVGDTFFEGLQSHSLPVTVVSGKATFKADLRLRVQAGAEASLDIFGIGAGAVVGIYANIIEFVAVIEETPSCPLEADFWWDLNVGAYAHLDVVVDYTTLGPVPTVSTTLLAASTVSTCLIEGASSTQTPSVSAMATPSTATPSTIRGVSSSLTFSGSSYVPASSTVSGSTSSSSAAATSVPQITSSPFPILSNPSSGFGYSASNLSIAASNTLTAVIVTTSAPVSPYSSASTYTSTHTYTLTRCGAPGAMNCPASYQSTVVVTRTSTYCPGATSTVSAGKTYPVPSSSHHSISTAVVALTPLPTPITATFTAALTTVGGVNVQAESSSYVTQTSTYTVTATQSVMPSSTYTPISTSPVSYSKSLSSAAYNASYPTPAGK